MVLLEELDDPAARLWYAAKASENGWSRKLLQAQIASDLRAVRRLVGVVVGVPIGLSPACPEAVGDAARACWSSAAIAWLSIGSPGLGGSTAPATSTSSARPLAPSLPGRSRAIDCTASLSGAAPISTSDRPGPEGMSSWRAQRRGPGRQGPTRSPALATLARMKHPGEPACTTAPSARAARADVRDPLANPSAVLAARRRPMSERLELALSWNALAAELRAGLLTATGRGQPNL
jgi:hypothetical protein